MDCEICLEEFNQENRIPKIVVPCGHTLCLQCLQHCNRERRACPMCRTVIQVPPESLPNNFTLLRLMEERQKNTNRDPRGWCSDCRSAAAPLCWDEEHDVQPHKRALKRHLDGVLQQVADQLEGLQDLCQGGQVVQALTLLTTESWNLTLRAGSRQLTGTVVGDTEDPLIKVMWLVVAAKAALTESRVRDPPPAARPLPPTPPPTARGRSPEPMGRARAPGTIRVRLPSIQIRLPADMDPPPPAVYPPPPAEARHLRQMNVNELSETGPNDQHQAKAAALVAAVGVERLVDVRCVDDPAWTYEMLQRGAPSLEQLSVVWPSEAHLLVVHSMPRLRRLFVTCHGVLDAQPPTLPALPEPGPGQEHCGLEWIRAEGLPRATLQSLLLAHARTLEEVVLEVGTPGNGRWPDCCSDLHNLVNECRLWAVWRIVLLRRGPYEHRPADCIQQRDEVHLMVPGTTVVCDVCDQMEAEDIEL